jgi:hypothetical protein
MRERNSVADGKQPKDIEWTSEEDMDAFLLEVNRRRLFGQSTADMDLPIVVVESSSDDD